LTKKYKKINIFILYLTNNKTYNINGKENKIKLRINFERRLEK